MSEVKSATELTLTEHLKACEQSKLSIADYARQKGVPAQRLYQARHLQNSKTKSIPAIHKGKNACTDNKRQSITEFLPVSLTPSLPSFSITTPNGFCIDIKQALPVEEMALLIKALQS